MKLTSGSLASPAPPVGSPVTGIARTRAEFPALYARIARHYLIDHPLASPRWAEAAAHFEEALALHDSQGRPLDLARTELAYGETLRRARRRGEARAHLRGALETFQRLGAAPWAERAGAELRATGERARRRNPSALSQLTPQELQIIRLVGEGGTNREIGERLAHILDAESVAHDASALPLLAAAAQGSLRDALSLLDQAIAFVNARDRPLALYCFTNEGDQERQVLDRTLSGGVTVNDCIFHVGQVSLPFPDFDFGDVTRVTIVACGTSYYAGLVASSWIEQLAGVEIRG